MKTQNGRRILLQRKFFQNNGGIEMEKFYSSFEDVFRNRIEKSVLLIVGITVEGVGSIGLAGTGVVSTAVIDSPGIKPYIC